MAMSNEFTANAELSRREAVCFVPLVLPERVHCNAGLGRTGVSADGFKEGFLVAWGARPEVAIRAVC